MLSLLFSLAFAEGTDTLGTTQALRAGTTLGVDVLAVGEVIRWEGNGAVTVTSPDGASRTDLNPGDSVVADQTGSWSFVSLEEQSIGTAWGLGVDNEVGRLWSKQWQFNAGSFAESAATNGSFYAKVPGGGTDATAVIELMEAPPERRSGSAS
jgi:hypothetical protein